MITLIEGRIGSGKSYFAVRDVLLKYYRFDTDKVHWVMRDDIADVVVYTNIDGFWVANDLDTAVKKAGGLEVFFTESYQKKFTRLKKHVYIIDEAQRASLFHKKFYNADVFFVFEYSRHLGIDFILITQDLYKLSPGLINLPEIHIKVQRRSMVVFRNSFVYMYMSDKDVLMKKFIKADPRIFAAYRSQRASEFMSVKSFSRRYLVIVLLLIMVACGGFYTFIKSFSWLFYKSSNDKIVSVSPKVVTRKLVGVVGGYGYYSELGHVIKEKIIH